MLAENCSLRGHMGSPFNENESDRSGVVADSQVVDRPSPVHDSRSRRLRVSGAQSRWRNTLSEKRRSGHPGVPGPNGQFGRTPATLAE